jgi:hypothetical protein
VTVYGRLRSDDGDGAQGDLVGGAYRGRAVGPRVLVGSREEPLVLSREPQPPARAAARARA